MKEPQEPTPHPGDATAWISPVPYQTEGPLPDPESLLEGPVYALWHEPMYESTPDKEEIGWVEVCFPTVGLGEAFFSGTVVSEYRSWDDDELTKVMKAGTVFIPKELEGHKLGEKLIRALIHEAVKAGCEEMDLDFKHPASFKAFQEIVGFDRMTFSERLGLNSKTEDEMLERITDGYGPKGHRPRILDDVRATEATIDLGGLDLAGWEVPQEFRVPIEADEW